MLCGVSRCCPGGWCDPRCVGNLVAHVVVPECFAAEEEDRADSDDRLEELLFHDEEEGAADWEAHHMLYGCTSPDDTLSAGWEPDSGCGLGFRV